MIQEEKKMSKYLITVNGGSYEVTVEEIGGVALLPGFVTRAHHFPQKPCTSFSTARMLRGPGVASTYSRTT